MKTPTRFSTPLVMRLSTSLVALLAISACGAGNRSAINVSAKAIESLGCKTSQSELWDSLQKVAEDGAEYPSADEVRKALTEAGEAHHYQGKAFESYVNAFVENYDVTIEGVRSKFGPNNTQMWRKALAEMEVGIRITDVHAKLADRISGSLEKLAQAEKALDATCTEPQPDPVSQIPPDSTSSEPSREPAGEMDPMITVQSQGTYDTVWNQLLGTTRREVYGARRVLATAYQSCDALSLSAMTANTPDVVGVAKDAKPNPQNGGILRHYGSLASINASHYYIAGQRLAGSKCQEVRNHPPIYDFGGKPYSTSSLPTTLNMFRGDGGSGSEVFGLDCSGFIFTSLATAGLRMIDPDPNKPLKATMVLGTPAAAFKEPQSNHLTCLEKIKVTKDANIHSGDIVATKGHIIMIDSVGVDPLGLSLIKSSASCSALSYKNFDFVIAQSSPSKGSIGINRFQARNYLAESTTMRLGLTQYAIAACRAKFGLDPKLSSPDLSVVRHKRTAECRVPDFQLTGSECVDSCKPI